MIGKSNSKGTDWILYVLQLFSMARPGQRDTRAVAKSGVRAKPRKRDGGKKTLTSPMPQVGAVSVLPGGRRSVRLLCSAARPSPPHLAAAAAASREPRPAPTGKRPHPSQRPLAEGAARAGPEGAALPVGGRGGEGRAGLVPRGERRPGASAAGRESAAVPAGGGAQRHC